MGLPHVVSTQVAKSTPFDNSTGHGYSSANVQDALEELRAHTVHDSETTATTASGTRTLTSTNKNFQFLTGTAAGYSVKLPDATTIPLTSVYQIANTTNQTISVKDSTGASLFTLGQNSIGYCYLQLNGTAAGTWVFWQVLASSTASGIINYQLTSTVDFVTTSTSDVQITSFTLTPQAGTYACWYNAESLLTTTPKTHWWSFYKNSTQVADSERAQDTAHSNQNMMDTTMSTITFNGTDTISVYVRTQNGTLTIGSRTMILIRLST
jgi:hypothetical protein